MDRLVDHRFIQQNDKGKIVGQLNKEGVAQLLVGLPQLSKAKRAKLAALLPHDQRKDGTWKPGGQLPGQKRPIAETSIVSETMDRLARSHTSSIRNTGR